MGFSDTRCFWLMVGGLLALRATLMVMPLTDPSEARYAVMAANMAERGDFLKPMFIHHGVFQSFDGKPPLFFQMGGVACATLGRSEFAVRLPSMLAAVAVLGMLFYTVRRLAGDRAAKAAVLICMSSGMFFLYSGLCVTDMLLTLCTTGAVCAHMLFFGAAGWRWERKAFSVLLFAFLGLGMITKGPVALVLAGLPMFAHVCAGRWWRELAGHAWMAGGAVFLTIALPWYVMMTLKNPDFLEYFFVNENFKRFVTPDYGDRYGSGRETFRGMALVWFWVANLPFLPAALVPLLRGRGLRGMLERRTVLAVPLLGCACMTGFWCLTSRVPMAYLLPTVPLASAFLAVALDARGMLERGWVARALKVGAPVSCGLVLLGLAAAGLGDRWTDKLPRRMYREVRRIQAEAPLEYAGTGFYFARRTPYSAEFYLGDALRNHAPEDVAESVERSGDDFLLVSRRYRVRMEAQPGRDTVFSNAQWTVFAPSQRRVEK